MSVKDNIETTLHLNENKFLTPGKKRNITEIDSRIDSYKI